MYDMTRGMANGYFDEGTSSEELKANRQKARAQIEQNVLLIIRTVLMQWQKVSQQRYLLIYLSLLMTTLTFMKQN